MALEHKPFELRIGRIMRHRRKLAGGYDLILNADNLIVPCPHAATLAFPWRGLCLALVVGLGFKALLMATFDAPTYTEKLTMLAEGRPLERAGAWVMQPDPASIAMARVIRLVQG